MEPKAGPNILLFLKIIMSKLIPTINKAIRDDFVRFFWLLRLGKIMRHKNISLNGIIAVTKPDMKTGVNPFDKNGFR